MLHSELEVEADAVCLLPGKGSRDGSMTNQGRRHRERKDPIRIESGSLRLRFQKIGKNLFPSSTLKRISGVLKPKRRQQRSQNSKALEKSGCQV